MFRGFDKALLIIVAGACALVPAGVAFAQDASGTAAAAPDASHHGHRHDRAGAGLVGAALRLDSLTDSQRASIRQLAGDWRTAHAPVRQADALLLTSLASQVDAGTIDAQALRSSVQARENAAVAARSTESADLQRLHDLLTPDQRLQLVSAVEAHAGRAHAGAAGEEHPLARLASWMGLSDAQRQQIGASLRAMRGASAADAGSFRAAHAQARRARLEAFASDAFDPSAILPDVSSAALERRAQRPEKLLQAALPVLTPAQRSQLAERLRARAARESRG